MKEVGKNGFRQKVASLLRQGGFFVQTIETETGPGVPDVWYTHPLHTREAGTTGVLQGVQSTSGWLELKVVQAIPTRPTTSLFKSLNHDLSIEQANWIDLCLRFGTKADILVAYKQEMFLVPGRYNENFNELTYSELRKFIVSKEQLVQLLRGNL